MKVVMLYITLMLTLVGVLRGQDAQFSQLESHSFLNNAAYTGNLDSPGKIQLCYRDQWSKALDNRGLKRIMIAYQQSININDDALSIGISLVGDEIGKSAYRHTQVQMSGGYRLRLSYNRYRRQSQYLSLGLMAGALQYSLNPEEFWFGSQYDIPNIEINPDLASGELIPLERFRTDFILDYGVGLRYELSREDRFHFSTGLAVNHIGTPDISLLEIGSAELSQKWVFNLSSLLYLRDQLFIHPSLWLMSQRASQQAMIGSLFGVGGADSSDLGFSIGAHSRIVRDFDSYSFESMIYCIRLDLESFTVSLSYDDTKQRVERSDRNFNAFELSLSYSID